MKNENELAAAVTEAQSCDPTVLIEEYIAGTELTCGVIMRDGVPLGLSPAEIRPTASFFDFDSKYEEGGSIELCPAPISTELTGMLQTLSVKAFELLSCRHYARIDWIVREGIPYFLEINTLPGMTKTSLLPKELAAAGISYQSFIASLIDSAKSS